ncbi:UDP-2,4-diacetamido-2,4,6-trideoxy-beta-L-altropyranose hydrolase [Pelagerythrobacter rhizovicinus]|uniref:UDP-2,4-diacetamido-2,4, 6-trideoxy-beta-L-altropyranose hydrolase n=1 Tax=Pelagerythrobacter rhizovicinus TaxID=2268576 RepID=UPI0013ED7845|nr:UDP-2,4-diacetamido-2,4,6-trideoxy-beta-L-altropyranose hydrolase [Pelagerythrobacter rhizovicinus]
MTSPVVLFRADASFTIGAGHVMRCLTLADGLRERGWQCRFICREYPGHLGENIARRGHAVQLLRANHEAFKGGDAARLAAPSAEDAAAVIAWLCGDPPAWIVVDHYSLDAEWEKAVSPHCDRLMVIDDLADRGHYCDVLLDQTFGRTAAEYREHVSAETTLLCGVDYALLRPEFSIYREHALRRRTRTDRVEQILVSLGGGDTESIVRRVLELLVSAGLPRSCRVKIVMGWGAPLSADIRLAAQEAPCSVDVLQGVDSMASLMAESDIAIGAAGSSSWERCCLGLPTVMIVLADNQRVVGESLASAGAALLVKMDDMDAHLPIAATTLVQDHAARSAMALRAASVVDGRGVERVIRAMDAAYAG